MLHAKASKHTPVHPRPLEKAILWEREGDEGEARFFLASGLGTEAARSET